MNSIRTISTSLAVILLCLASACLAGADDARKRASSLAMEIAAQSPEENEDRFFGTVPGYVTEVLVRVEDASSLEKLVQRKGYEEFAVGSLAHLTAAKGDLDATAKWIGRIGKKHLRSNAAESVTQILLAESKDQEALKLAEKLEGSASDHAYLALAQWAATSDEPAKARTYAEKIQWPRMGPDGTPQGARMYAQYMQRTLEGFLDLAQARKGKEDQAVIASLSSRDSRMSYALLHWGHQLVREGRLEAARKLTEKVNDDHGLRVWARILRADLQADDDRAFQADLERARRLIPRMDNRFSPHSRMGLPVAEVLLQFERKEEARDWLDAADTALEASMEDVPPAMHKREKAMVFWYVTPDLVRYRAWAGDLEGARKWLDVAKDLKPPMWRPGRKAPSRLPDAYRALARGATAAGMAQKADAVYQENQPEIDRVYLLLGKAQGWADRAQK